MVRRFFVSALLMIGVIMLHAQTGRGPVVHQDHSVTFTLDAPDAKHVRLEGSFSKKPIRMQQVDGLWTARLDSLPAEIYTYRYLLKKKKPINDPANQQQMRDVDEIWNYFIVEDSITRNYIEQEVPHGRLEYVWYPSTLNGMSQRRLAVYLPSGYEQKAEVRYPVLYLLHGSGGDETAWVDCGRVCQILDNLMAAGKAKPCIVVMPNGNANLDAAPGESPWMQREPSAMNALSMTGMIEQYFVKEVVSFIDRRYKTVADRTHRAIAGLSLGGLHSIYISVNHPTLFDYVGLFSAQATNMLDDERRQLMIHRAHRNNTRIRQAWGIIFNFDPDPSLFDLKLSHIDTYANLDEKLDRLSLTPPKVYYIAIGKDDLLLDFNRKFMQKLDQHHIVYDFHLTEGAHSWENWRRYLVDLLPKLF